jgi:hypothetical protein
MLRKIFFIQLQSEKLILMKLFSYKTQFHFQEIQIILKTLKVIFNRLNGELFQHFFTSFDFFLVLIFLFNHSLRGFMRLNGFK